MCDFLQETVRSSAILTTDYVAGTVIDGGAGVGVHNQNQLELYVDFTIGGVTSLDMIVETSNYPAIYTQAYDGQTANFTVGERIRGLSSGVEATVIADTDAGATGTLTLVDYKPSAGHTVFLDNETIKGTTSGIAVVNGARAAATTYWYRVTTSSSSGGTVTVYDAVWTRTTSGQYRISIPVKDRYIRVSVKGTGGVVAGSLCAITANLGQV